MVVVVRMVVGLAVTIVVVVVVTSSWRGLCSSSDYTSKVN